MISFAEKIKTDLGGEWIPAIYRSRVRSMRTRAFRLDLPGRENEVSIEYSLLGIQLKCGRKLIGCPELSTARFLRVFARIGCREIAVPYDITKISSVADEFESAWQIMLLLIQRETESDSPQLRGRKRAAVIRLIRQELEDIGAGDAMPAFDTETRQRKSE